MNIGNRIIKLRTNINISSRQLALKVGMSPGYLADIEKGNKTPTIAMLNKICSALNITLKNFFDTNDNSVVFPKHFKQFFEENKNLTPDQLEQLTNFLKTLK